MLNKEKPCTACSGSGYYCGSKCGACNGTGLEYSKDDIIEALENELSKLQKTAHNSNYAKCKVCSKERKPINWKYCPECGRQLVYSQNVVRNILEETMTAEQMFNELTWFSDSWDDEYISFHKDQLLGYLIGLEKQLQNTSSNSDYAKCPESPTGEHSYQDQPVCVHCGHFA